MLKFTCALLLLVQVLQKSFLLFRLSAVETFLYQLSYYHHDNCQGGLAQFLKSHSVLIP